MPARPPKKPSKSNLIYSLADFDRLYFPDGLETGEGGVTAKREPSTGPNAAQLDELRSRLKR